LPVDQAVSTSYGRLAAAAVLDAGRQPRRCARDLLIAATAHAHGARLYTRNAADFAGLETLVDIVEV
jgi:predicted nucleic acid-binding protein